MALFRFGLSALRAITSRTSYLSALSGRRAMSAITTVGDPEKETEEEFDAKYVDFFSRPEIDGWECRKAMENLQSMDLIPEPKIIIAALKACRRLNDYALAIRFMEAVKDKCGPKVDTIYPYLLQEIQPTLTELGISTLEEMGYDKPELHFPNVYDMHGPDK